MNESMNERAQPHPTHPPTHPPTHRFPQVFEGNLTVFLSGAPVKGLMVMLINLFYAFMISTYHPPTHPPTPLTPQLTHPPTHPPHPPTPLTPQPNSPTHPPTLSSLLRGQYPPRHRFGSLQRRTA